MFSCEFCDISKNTFFTEHLWATASDISHEAKIWQFLRFRTLLTAIFSGNKIWNAWNLKTNRKWKINIYIDAMTVLLCYYGEEEGERSSMHAGNYII